MTRSCSPQPRDNGMTWPFRALVFFVVGILLALSEFEGSPLCLICIR